MNGGVNYLKFLISGDSSQLDSELKKSKRTVTGYVDDISSSVGKLTTAFGGLLAGISVAGVVGKLVSVQREFDVLNSSLTTVTGSSAAAAREMAWIKDFAKETPYGLAQATEGFVKMKALGLNPTRESLTSFGNTASAMGKDLMQMIEAVADASTGEFERLKEFGVKSAKEGENVKFTFQGVTTTVRNSSEEITAYLESIGNNQFASAMSERAKTLDGAIAALGDSWDELFRTVNQNNTGGFIYDSVTLANGALEDLNTILQASNDVMSDGATAGGAYKTVQEGLATVFETVAVLGTNVKYVLTGVGTELGGLAAQAAAVLRGDFEGAAEIRRQMVTDAENARIKVDTQTEAILSARKRAADAIAAKPAAGSDLASLADSVNGYKPQTVTDASLKGMADSLLKSSAGFKSAAESMSEVSKKGDEIRAMLKRLKEQDLGDSPQAKQLEDRLVGVKEKLKSMAEKADGGAKSTKQLQTAYGNFLSSLEEKIALETVDLENGKKATESEKLRIKFQQELQGSLKGLTAAQKASVTAKLDELEALEKQNQLRKEFLQLAELERTRRLEAFRAAEQTVGGLLEGNKQLREEIELIGLSATQQQAITMARQQAVIAVKEQHLAEMERASDSTGFMSREQIALQQEIELLKERLALTSLKYARETSATATAASVSEWQRGVEQIGQSLSDQLMSGGRGFGEYLKNLGRTLVFKPVIQAIVQPVGGFVANMMGVPNGGGAVGSGLGAVNDLSSLYSAFSGGLVSTVGGAIGSLGATFGSSALTSIAAGMKGSTLAAGLAGPTTAGATGAMGLGSAIGAALPWVAGGLAVASLLGGVFDHKSTQEYGGTAMYSAARGTQTSSAGGAFGTGFGGVAAHDQILANVAGISKSIVDALDSTAKSFGKTVGYEAAAGFASDFGDDATWGGLRIALGGKDIVNWNDNRQTRWAPKEFASGDEGYKQYLQAVATDVRSALLGMDLPGWANQLVSAATDLDTINAALQQVAAVRTMFDSLGRSMQMFAGISGDLQTQLIKASGSVDALSSNVGAFYQGFYTEQERMGGAQRQLRESLSGLGIGIDPAFGDYAKEQFRATVEAAMAGGQGELAAQLLALSGSFATVADYAQKAAADSVARLNEIMGQQHMLWADLAEAEGDYATAAQRRYWIETAGMTQAEQAAYDYIAAIRQQVSAAQQLKQLSDTRWSLENDLLSAQGNTSEVARRQRERDLAEMTKGLDAEQAAKVTAAYDYNVALRAQIETQRLASEAAQQAAQAQQAAAEQIRSSWQSIGDSVVNEINRIRGLVVGDSSMGLDYYQAQFAIATGQARAGDQTAASKLAEISQAMLGVAQSGALSMFELQRLRATTASSLEDTLDELQKKFGISVAVPQFAGGGLHGGGLRIVGETGWELEATGPSRIWNQQQIGQALSGGGGNAELVAAVNRLTAENAKLADRLAAIESNTGGLLEITDNKSEGGNADRVEIMNIEELAKAIVREMA